jgi:hypothetical protein
MFLLHPDAKPVFASDDHTKQIGWIVETKHFSFEAIEQDDGTVNAYVEWGDDQDGDMSNDSNWIEAQAHLRTLIKSSESV